MKDPFDSHPDARRHRRTATKVYADLYWEGPDMAMRFARAYCLDVSEGGLRVRLPGGGPESGASVNVRIEAFGFSEYGFVRHSSARGVLGIEFRFEGASEDQIARWRKIVRSVQG